MVNRAENAPMLEIQDFLPYAIERKGRVGDVFRNCTTDQILEIRQMLNNKLIKGMSKVAFVLALGKEG